MGVCGTQSLLHEAGSQALEPRALPPSPAQGFCGPWGGVGQRNFTPFCLCSCFLPPKEHSTSSRALPGGAFPSPAEGPLGPLAQAHPFPVPPQLRPHLGWKVSLKIGGSFSFLPGGPGRAKASCGGAGGAPRSPARREVTRPPSQTAGLARPARHVPQPRRWRKDSHSIAGELFFHSGVSGAICRRSAGPHFPEAPLSPRPRARHSKHKNSERVFIYLRAQESGP